MLAGLSVLVGGWDGVERGLKPYINVMGGVNMHLMVGRSLVGLLAGIYYHVY